MVNAINVQIAANIASEYKLTAAQRFCYEAIRSFMDSKEFTAYPSINRIARLLGVCRNTAKKYIGELETIGLISVTERIIRSADGSKWNDTHLYTFVAEKFGNAKKRVSKSRDKETCSKSSYQKLKDTFISARTELLKVHSEKLVNSAIGDALKNIRRGYSIVSPFKYLEAIVESKKAISDDQVRLTEDPDFKDSIGYDNTHRKNTTYTKSYNSKVSSPFKTKFHNFEQRSSKYTKEELDKLVEERQRNK